MNDKTIVWGAVLFDIHTMKDAEIRITNIHIDSFNNIVTITKEVGLNIDRITMTMENARAIGFINLNALSGYC